MKRIHLIISGRVQGVFYRAAVRDVASQYKVAGFVRNLPDGTVEVVAEGEEEELRRFAGDCRINDGVREARDVQTEWSDTDSPEYHEFSIQY